MNTVNVLMALLMEGMVTCFDDLEKKSSTQYYLLRDLHDSIMHVKLCKHGLKAEKWQPVLIHALKKWPNLITNIQAGEFQFNRPADNDYSEEAVRAREAQQQYQAIMAERKAHPVVSRASQLEAALEAERQKRHALLERLKEIQKFVGTTISDFEDGGK